MGKFSYTTPQIQAQLDTVQEIKDTGLADAQLAQAITDAAANPNAAGFMPKMLLDTAALTNDNDHIPTSGVVKSALTSEVNVAVTAISGTAIDKHVCKNGIVTICGHSGALTGGGDNALATITDSSYLNTDLFSGLSVLFNSASDSAKLIAGNSGLNMNNGQISIRITGALSAGFRWMVQYQL